MSNSPTDPVNRQPESSPPTALVRPVQQSQQSRLKTRLWWLCGICLLVAIGLSLTSFRNQGTVILIHFQEGHGLKPGDTLRYRGIDLGKVISIGLTPKMDGVTVKILLAPANHALAVEDSQFWIQRARLSLGGVSGIDTVLGAKYVGVIPGSSHTAKTEFVGTETPLLMTDGDDAEIGIKFPAGEGLEVGDPVKFRGIKVGEVIGIHLEGDLQSVEVSVRLVGSAQKLARVGTQFWIERPRIDLTEVRGIDTLIAGKYIALQPTSSDAPLAKAFEGLSEPPPLPRREGSLEVELDAPQRMGIVRGAPVIYRGLEVGRVANVGLSRDGATVKISAVIEAEYVELVREKSRWWAVGGVDIAAGLSGIRVSVESLSTWVRGGVAFATPTDDPGKQVVTGYRFMLESEPKEEWLRWQPRIATGNSNRHATDLPSPVPVRVVANWRTSILGIPKRNSEKSWGLALSTGDLVVPTRLIKAAAESGATVNMEVCGVSFVWSKEITNAVGPITSIKLPVELPKESGVELWPKESVGQATGSTKLLLQIYNPELAEPIAIDHTRLEKSDSGFKIAPGVGLSTAIDGSPVIDSSNGQVIGLLVRNENGWVIGQLP